MRTSARSGFHRWSKGVSVTDRTAVYGPVRTVVWEGSAGDRRPYPDQTALGEVGPEPSQLPTTRLLGNNANEAGTSC